MSYLEQVQVYTANLYQFPLSRILIWPFFSEFLVTKHTNFYYIFLNTSTRQKVVSLQTSQTTLKSKALLSAFFFALLLDGLSRPICGMVQDAHQNMTFICKMQNWPINFFVWVLRLNRNMIKKNLLSRMYLYFLFRQYDGFSCLNMPKMHNKILDFKYKIT